MTDEELDKYVRGRFAEALDWYNRRSKQNKFTYQFLSLYVLVASGFLAVAGDLTGTWVTVRTVIATGITISAGLLGLFKSQENWLSYRATWDALKRESSLHVAGIGDYQHADDRNALFVERIESIMAKEGVEWRGRQGAAKENPAPR